MHTAETIAVTRTAADQNAIKALLGRFVQKYFDGYGTYTGKVTQADKDDATAQVVYEDGAIEHLFLDQIQSSLLPPSYKPPHAREQLPGVDQWGCTWPPPTVSHKLIIEGQRRRKPSAAALERMLTQEAIRLEKELSKSLKAQRRQPPSSSSSSSSSKKRTPPPPPPSSPSPSPSSSSSSSLSSKAAQRANHRASGGKRAASKAAVSTTTTTTAAAAAATTSTRQGGAARSLSSKPQSKRAAAGSGALSSQRSRTTTSKARGAANAALAADGEEESEPALKKARSQTASVVVTKRASATASRKRRTSSKSKAKSGQGDTEPPITVLGPSKPMSKALKARLQAMQTQPGTAGGGKKSPSKSKASAKNKGGAKNNQARGSRESSASHREKAPASKARTAPKGAAKPASPLPASALLASSTVPGLGKRPPAKGSHTPGAERSRTGSRARVRSWSMCLSCGRKHWTTDSCARSDEADGDLDPTQLVNEIVSMRRKWTGLSTTALLEILKSRRAAESTGGTRDNATSPPSSTTLQDSACGVANGFNALAAFVLCNPVGGVYDFKSRRGCLRLEILPLVFVAHL